GLHRDAALPRRRDRALRLRHRVAEPRRARGDRKRSLALPRRSLALQRAGDRGTTRRRRRADPARARGLVPARARERERRDPGRGRASARSQGRGGPGSGARGTARVGDARAGRLAVTEAEARERAAELLAAAGIVLTPAERQQIEVADFGLGRLEE